MVPQLPAVPAVGGQLRPGRAGVLPDIRDGVGFRRRLDGPQQQAVGQRRQQQQGKDIAGHPEAGQQSLPLDGGLCFQLGLPAGRCRRGSLGTAEPSVYEKGHVRPHREGCDEEEQYQLYESNAHESFSFAMSDFGCCFYHCSIAHFVFFSKTVPGLTRPGAAPYARRRRETPGLGCFPKKSTQNSQKFLIDRV